MYTEDLGGYEKLVKPASSKRYSNITGVLIQAVLLSTF